jgi:hypothetical protein
MNLASLVNTLQWRIHYGGRKGRSAARRLAKLPKLCCAICNHFRHDVEARHPDSVAYIGNDGRRYTNLVMPTLLCPGCANHMMRPNPFR